MFSTECAILPRLRGCLSHKRFIFSIGDFGYIDLPVQFIYLFNWQTTYLMPSPVLGADEQHGLCF